MRKLPYMHLPMRGKSFSPWMGSRYLFSLKMVRRLKRSARKYLVQYGSALRIVQIGDPDVPTIRERRAAIEQLAEAAFPPHTTLSILN